jgi:GT2 family glycosyltransferase
MERDSESRRELPALRAQMQGSTMTTGKAAETTRAVAPRANAVLVAAAGCTRGRGSSVVPTIETILAGDYADLFLIIVDQSDDDATAKAVTPFLSGGSRADRRVVYVRCNTAGLSRSRNRAIAEAARRGCQVVAFTDDDCTVPPHWLATMACAFNQDERVAVAFCNVLAAPHDPDRGYIPTYQRRGDLCVRSIYERLQARGIGAGMAVRVAAMEAVGGFDEQLGAGAALGAGEDHDISLRTLLAGWHICETDRTHVIHDGFRLHSECRDLMRRSWLGIGAAFAKPFRAGHVRFVGGALYEAVVHALWPPLREMARLRRPRGAVAVPAFMWGLAFGLASPIDRETLRFEKRGERETRIGERCREVKGDVHSIA